MTQKRLLLISLIALSVAVFYALDLHQYLSLDVIKQQQARIEAYRAAHPWLSSLAYVTVYVLMAGLSLPGAAVLTLLGGAVFGLVWGTLLALFASTIGATAAFLAARFVLRDWVRKHFSHRLTTIDTGLARDGTFYLFTLRLVPVFPFFIINLLMGLTRLPTRTFFWVSLLGMLPGAVVYVNAGTQLARLEGLHDILSPGLVASFTLLGLFPWLARALLRMLKARRIYAGWRRPRRFDRNLVVIGAGSAGLVSAYIAAAIKARVTLVEKNRMGGDCLNTGCVPSKALIRTARLLADIRRADKFGLQEATADFDMTQVMQRVHAVIQRVAPHDSVERYCALGVDVIQGTARLVSPWAVEITAADGSQQTLTSRSIVIATGARPTVPPIPGLDEVGYLTSDTLWDLRELPGRLLVLGGGPIGCELAQAFSRMGSKVTLLEMAPRILIREDPEVAELVTERMRDEGVNILLEHRAVRCMLDNQEKLLLAEHAGREQALAFDALLVAVGRSANLDGYGLEELGIPAGRTIETNAFLQTAYPNIYAAGDVAGPYQFTHTAAHQAWYATVNALFNPFKKFRADYSVIPWATFTDPEVARVGLNEQDASEQGVAYEVTRYALDDLDRAIADDAAYGFVKVLTVPGRDRLLGATIVGSHAADMLAEFVLAMRHGIGLDKILGTVHIYPTMSEANKHVAGQWKKTHAPKLILRAVERFHRWRRGTPGRRF